MFIYLVCVGSHVPWSMLTDIRGHFVRSVFSTTEVTSLESKHFYLPGRLADLSVTFVYMLQIFDCSALCNFSTHSSVAGHTGLWVVFGSQRICL